MHHDRTIKSIRFLEERSIHAEWEAKYLNEDLAEFHDAAYARLVERLGARKGQLVLDVGCGYCLHAARLARHGLRVIGVDCSPVALEEGRRNLECLGLADRVELVQANMLDLPFEEGRFDHVNCWGVLMHVPELLRAVDELVRVLRVGGRLAICEVNAKSLHVQSIEPMMRMVKRALGRPVPTRRRRPQGIEEWREDAKGGGLLVRKLDLGYLIDYLAERRMEMIDRFATELTELYTSLPARVLKLAAYRINRLYFEYMGPPSLAQGNVCIFEKRAR